MKKLVSLSDFILQQDKEFPAAMMADEFINILGQKYQAIVKYTKFLNKILVIEMFEGENKIFHSGEYQDIQPSTNSNYYTKSGKNIFRDRNGVVNGSIGLKISDLTDLGLMYDNDKTL